jgi:hypothetical protein
MNTSMVNDLDPSISNIKDIHEAKWTTAKREEYHKSHPENFAGPGTSFPIEDAEDVKHAAQLHGHADNPAAVKSKIISIAKRLGHTAALPKEWQEDAQDGDDPDDEDEFDPTASKDNLGSAHVTAHDERMHIEPRIIEQVASGASAGHDVRVTIVKGGRSANGYYYDENALREIARLVEGAQAFADHGRSAADQTVRSVRDVVGFYHDAAFVPAAAGQPAHVDATLHIFEAADWLWSIVREAIALGRPELIGLSIDIFGQWQMNEATKAKEVTKVVSLNSCDIVTRPSAGGAFRRILHHDNTPTNKGVPKSMPEQHVGTGLAPIHNAAPAPAPEQPQQQNTPPQDQAQTTTHSHILEQQQILEQQRLQVEQLLQDARLQRAELTLERRLQESILPAAVKEQIKSRFKGRIFEEAELDAEMSTALTMMAQLSKEGLIRGNGYEKSQVSGMISEAEKVQAAFDLMFDLEIDRAKLGNIRGFDGIREAYARVTGDPSVVGISAHTTLGNIRVSEAAPIARITEADTTTASFSYLLGTSMNKRLLKDYQAWPAEWQKFCSLMPIRDFKQQTRVRFGAFGSLPVVAEDTAYQAVTLQDSASTYVPQKRGNLVTVSREVIMNDDLQAIKQIPTKLAVAAAYTLAEFVYGFLSSNPNIYDGNPLFTSGAPHNNLGSSNLSSAAMQAGVTAMREQTNFAGKRIGLRPRYLIVPPELEFTAMVVTKSAGIPGSPNNDINPMLGYVTPIVSPQLASATQWFFAADPREVDTIEVGFVGGQVNPALFIQDQPLTYAKAA